MYRGDFDESVSKTVSMNSLFKTVSLTTETKKFDFDAFKEEVISKI